MDSLVSNDGRGLKPRTVPVDICPLVDSLVSNDGRGLKQDGEFVVPKGVYDSLVSNDGRGLKRLHAMVDVADVKIRSSVMTGVD